MDRTDLTATARIATLLSPYSSAAVTAVLGGDVRTETIDAARREVAAYADRLIARERRLPYHPSSRQDTAALAQAAYDELAALAEADRIVSEKWGALEGARDTAFDVFWDANYSASYDAALSAELDSARERVEVEGIDFASAWAGAPARAERAAFDAAWGLALFAARRRIAKGAL